MAGITITGKEVGPDGKPQTDFVPRGADYTVFTIPEESVVREGKASGGAIALELDPGKYRIKVRKHELMGVGGNIRYIANWERFFYVGMDEATWRNIRYMRPKWVSAVNTSDGPRYRCKLPGCQEVNMSQWGAMIHEMKDHFGIDPLKATLEEVENQTSAALPVSPTPKMRMSTNQGA